MRTAQLEEACLLPSAYCLLFSEKRSVMKGVILAGGAGSRLYPLTKSTNKHLLPVRGRPMICYPLQTLIEAGIGEILIVTGRDSIGDFTRLLGDGTELGIEKLSYAGQDGNGGIAAALALAEDFADGAPLCVMLGDNIIEGSIVEGVRRFRKQPGGARVFIKQVDDPAPFGVPELLGDEIIRIEEKPSAPKSPYAVVGIYLYDNRVFDIIRTLKPSARGELEITDVNNVYISQKQMGWEILPGWWVDAGTIENLILANRLVAEKDLRFTLKPHSARSLLLA